MSQNDSTPITRLRGLLAATRLIREEPDAARLLEAIARTVQESLGYGVVVMNTYRPAWNDFEVTTVVGDEAARESLMGERLAYEGWAPLLDERFQRCGTYLIPEGEIDWDATLGRRYETAPRRGSWRPGDELFVPMKHSQGHFLGIISVADPVSGNRPADGELEVLAAVAEHAAMALEASHDHAASERQQAALGQLLEVSSKMTETLSVDAVFEAVCQGISDALGFVKVALDVPDADTGVLELRAEVGWEESELDDLHPLTLDELAGLLDPAFEIEGCYLMSRQDALARLPEGVEVYTSVQNGTGPWAWAGHWLMVPLHDPAGNVTGVIWVDEPTDRLLPERPMLQTLRVFANQATAALDSSSRFQEMRFLAEHDWLTRLHNRRAFNDRLDAAIERSERYETGFALVLCDLDELKAINDRDGHAAGDAALMRVARQLRGSVRGSDTVFRIGGDEFALILPEADALSVRAVMKRIGAGLAAAADNQLPLRASLGASVYPADGADADALFHAADTAMYADKRDGRVRPRRAA